MNPAENSIPVGHNEAEHRFEAVVDGHVCVAEYQLREGDMVITHTFVAPELRGRGLAEELVRPALEYARANNLRVVPACSYVDAFIRRHPEFQPLISPNR